MSAHASTGRRPHWLRFASVLGVALVTALGALVVRAGSADAAVTAKQISVPAAPTGWASWNSLFSSIDAKAIRAQADAFVAAGLPGAGYKYINIDEGWWQGNRDSAGNITVDTTRWPGGMAAIASYIHSKGLKAGIYTDVGRNGCGYYYPTTAPAAPNTGSEGHYDQDMLQFQRWGFDLVKVDWCGGQKEGLDAPTAYRAVSAAISKATATTGRPMVLSICEWGTSSPWNWAPGVAPMWRTSTDIVYYKRTASLTNVLANFDQAQHPAAEHTGYYNDPDMMLVGMPGLSAAQSRTHLNLWAIAGAPLLAGVNLTTMSTATASILTNTEVVAVDQDPRGLPGVKVAEDRTGLQVYGKVLSGTGRRAVVLLNRTGSTASITVRWANLGLGTASATVRNVWTHATVGTFATSATISVPANDSVMLTVTGTEAAATTYEAEAAGNTRTGKAAVAACTACSGGSNVGYVGSGTANGLRFNGIKASAAEYAVATIAYVNGDGAPRTATLSVNGTAGTAVAFPTTGSWTTPGTVSVLVPLAKGSTNTLAFANSSAWAPDFDAIEIRPLPGS